MFKTSQTCVCYNNVFLEGVKVIEQVWENSMQKVIGKKAQPITPFDFSISLQDKLKDQHSSSTFKDPPKNSMGQNHSHRHITDTQLQKLLPQLLQRTQDSVLFLRGNQITDHGLIDIANQLKSNQSIKHVILSNNCIQCTEFAKAALMDLLKVNHYIGWLVLNGNHIDDQGALVLAESLDANTGLQHLVLSDNQISDAGFEHLLNHLKHHPTLKSLFIANNKLSNHCLSLLLTFLKENKSITRIDISGHSFTDRSLLNYLTEFCDRHNIHLIS